MSSRGRISGGVRHGVSASSVGLFWIIFGWGAAAAGQSWVARCNELEFRFDRETKLAQVSMVTAKGLFPLAQGKVHFDNGLAMRAGLSGLGEGAGMDVGLNRDRKIVYVLRKTAETGAKDDAVFCATDIRVE